jgi:hypothetical protein
MVVGGEFFRCSWVAECWLGSALFALGARPLGSAAAILFGLKVDTPRHPSDVRFGSPRKRTYAVQNGMSAKGQKQTFRRLFDHPVRTQKRLSNGEANRLRGLQIDDQLKPRWLLDQQAIFPQRRVRVN